MKNTQDEFEKKFRERFSGFEEEPDKPYFAAIRQQIDTSRIPVKFLVVASLTGILVAVIFTMLVWYYQNTSVTENKVTQKTSIKENTFKKGNMNTNSNTAQNNTPKNTKNIASNNQTLFYNSILTHKIQKTEETGNQKTAESDKNNFHENIKTDVSKKYTKPYFLQVILSKQNLPKPTTFALKQPHKLRLNFTGKPDKSQPDRHFFYFSVNPVMSYYHVSPDKNDNIFISNVSAGKVISSERSGIKLQTGFVFPVQEKIHLRLGILYSRFQENWHFSAHQSNDTLSQQYTFTQTNFQIGGKIDGIYQFQSSLRWRAYVLTGIELQKRITQEINTFKIMSYWHAGTGLGYKITPDITFFAEPDLAISFNRQKDEKGYLKVRPYHLGINTGVVFRIP
jgi:hypothetical protein